YKTILGGTRDDHAGGIGVDDDGNAYVAGTTSNLDSGFPITEGAYKTEGADFFITKLDPNGDLVYSTLFGGRNISSFGGFTAYGAGDTARVALVGTTVRGFPTTANAYRRDVRGTSDTFLVVFELARSEPAAHLLYSTVFGSGASDTGLGVAAGPDGKIYMTGNAQAGDLPMLHAFDATWGGGRDAFLAVFDISKTGDESLFYSTYIGGNNTENGTAGDGGVAVGPDGIAL